MLWCRRIEALLLFDCNVRTVELEAEFSPSVTVQRIVTTVTKLIPHERAPVQCRLPCAMAAAGLFAMPLVIVNMGGEMVYILAQRLQAQNVPLDKSKRVLQDVIRTMYNKMFIEELFRPQDVYSMHSTRQIFDRLAHSSIMRLNESSMDKLFDLMTMGFKALRPHDQVRADSIG